LAEIAAAVRSGRYTRSKRRPDSSRNDGGGEREGASATTSFWHPYQGAQVSLVRNDDGTFTPTDVVVTLHSAGMLVERVIKAPEEIRMRRFPSEDLAAHSMLAELGFDNSLVP
jgi:hypothetical protein